MTYSTFASESVCAGHPDKLADQISDAIVDAALAQDPKSHLAIETVVTRGRTILCGEIKSTAKLDPEAIARAEIKRLGYTRPEWGFSNADPIIVNLSQQSPEIALGADHDGAGDQGMMFGYACRETPEFMPLPIMLAHAITRRLDEAAAGPLPYLRPDGKAQVVVRYEDGRPTRVEHVTVAKPHDESVPLEQVKTDLYREVVVPALAAYGHKVPADHLVVNGTGVWHHPGPAADAGLTGRKIVVDAYGGFARVGGGAFSGKDPTKVDRSGAYAARYIAKNLVAAGLADRAEVALAYVIGHKRPVMQEIETFGTATADSKTIRDFAGDLIDTSVSGIIEHLDLRQPRYHATAAYGHFGKTNLPWEALAKVPAGQLD